MRHAVTFDMEAEAAEERLLVRTHGNADAPTLLYLPGLHGDWTLMAGFRAAAANRFRLVEVTYPRSLTWSVSYYASAITEAVLDEGITSAWLLGESWGSQVSWELIRRAAQPGDGRRLSVEGLVLAGGFVKHPFKWGPGLLRRIGEGTSMARYRRELRFYEFYSRFRHGSSPEVRAGMAEFVARRTDLDRQAMRYRLDLLEQYDPSEVARAARIPIHYLAGLIDPLVPWVLVRRWLRRNCAAYRGGKTCWTADHNVLASAPRRSVEVIERWMREARAG